MKKLPQIIFIFCIASLVYIVFQELPFFWYVKTFGLRESVYRRIDLYLENAGFILLLPASYVLYRIINLNGRSNKVRIFLYAIFSLLIPLLLFPSITAGRGDISGEYHSYSVVYWPRLYFRLLLSLLPVFYVWPLLTSIVKLIKKRNRQILLQIGLYFGLILSSMMIAGIGIYVISDQMNSLLDRLLLPTKVNSTFPDMEGFINQKIVITDIPRPLLKCYLEENPGDFSAHVLNSISGTSFMTRINYNSYYLNSKCLVVYLGLPVTLDNIENTKSQAILSELLIRASFGDLIKVNKNKLPFDTISIKKEEFFTKGSNRGTYESETNTIELQEGYNLAFETLTHEILHSLSVDHELLFDYPYSGINEATTEYLTGSILKNIPDFSRFLYEHQVTALESLLKIIDEKTLIDTYFNGDFRSLQKQVDDKTYGGAFCRFNHYLDKSLVEYIDTRNFELSKEYAFKAIKTLEVKEEDDLKCN